MHLLKVLFSVLFIFGAHTVFACESDSTVQTASVCHHCHQPFEKLQTCARCKIAKYCGKECQTQAWKQGHKDNCKPPVQAQPITVQNKLTKDFWLGSVDPSSALNGYLRLFKDIRQTAPINTIIDDKKVSVAVSEYINSRGTKPTILIVGCGKCPYDWNSELKVGTNQWQSTGPDGDHTHSDALTLAETGSVSPQIVMDFLLDLPQSMYGKFDEVYFEKLPPGLLAQAKIYRNAYAALKPGGLLFVDFQLRTAYELIDAPVHVSPFERVDPSSYKGHRPDDGDASINKRFQLFGAGMSELGFTNVRLESVRNNKYNHRQVQTQAFATKPR